MYRLLVLFLAISVSPVLAEEAPAPAKTAKDLVKEMKDKDPSVRARAALEAVEFPDGSVSSQLVKLLKDADPSVRMTAIESLTLRTEPAQRKQAGRALASRLAPLERSVSDLDEYLLVISALHDLALPETIRALLDFSVDEDRETAAARLKAVGNVPSAAAIEALIAFASKGRNKGRNRQKESAIDALRYATGQKLGSDPDKWRAWWREVKDRFDFEAAAEARSEDRERAERKRQKREERRRKREEREQR